MVDNCEWSPWAWHLESG